MGSRLELQSKLEDLLGSKNVYYKPPASVSMEYTAIRFSRARIDTRKANDSTYSKFNRYELTVISKRADDPVIDKLLDLPYCSYDRSYKADNLYHDVLTLYY